MLAKTKRGVHVTMKEIPLTQGKVALVDDEDFGRLNKFKWYANSKRNTFYAGRGGTRSDGKRFCILMHQEIIETSNGMEIDHINGNGLDNRRVNLRSVTTRGNHQNLHIKKTSKYPGIYQEKESKKWRAQIQINGKRQYLGKFKTEIEAFNAYCSALKNIGEVLS